MKAKHNYKAQKPDELTFPRHAIIQNVNKVEEGWWKGDYGGSRQHWFPANHVEEIQPENISEGVCFRHMYVSRKNTPILLLSLGLLHDYGTVNNCLL